jgi:hypothetical protein
VSDSVPFDENPFGLNPQEGLNNDVEKNEEVQPKTPRGGPVISGKRINIPSAKPLPHWDDTHVASQDEGDVVNLDYADLNAVNRDLVLLRLRLHKVRRAMRQAAREAVEAKLRYQRSLRRALVQQSGGTAETRKASAELLCEDLEADMVMKSQIVEEYSSLFRSIRDDVENAKTIAYNLRSLVNIL